MHLVQPDSLELRGHLVMFQSTTLQGQPGIAQELCTCICCINIVQNFKATHLMILIWSPCPGLCIPKNVLHSYLYLNSHVPQGVSFF